MELMVVYVLQASFNAEEANREGAVLDTSKIQRIQQLETLLQEFKDANTQLMKEVDALGGQSVTLGRGKSREALSAEIEEAQQAKLEMQKGTVTCLKSLVYKFLINHGISIALEAAEAESKHHFDKIEELEQSLFELTGEIGAGRHVPPGVRVLSMKDNPEQQWVDLRQSVMDRLKGENEALMKRLKELEESGARVEGKEGDQGEAERELVPRESWELVTKEKTELEEVVRQKEKRLLRLQQVCSLYLFRRVLFNYASFFFRKQIFRSKSAEFREAIASILGLKLAFYDNGQVRVTSIYDLNAAFVFQPTSNAEGVKMQLVAQGEGGPQDLPNLMQYWIENEQCIPGFLASVTLECYDKSKRSVDNSSGVGL
jgi:mitotic spindle assembly checkpoint protein MAD1